MIALLVTLAFSWYMTGMIWSMQVFEYPLFALVGPKEFPSYHRRHNRGLPFLVIVPSLLAFLSAVVLLFTRPARLPLWASVVVAALDLVIIIVTAVREAPLHAKLDRDGASPVVIRQLVQGNWVRTLVWTANALFLLALTGYLLGVTQLLVMKQKQLRQVLHERMSNWSGEADASTNEQRLFSRTIHATKSSFLANAFGSKGRERQCRRISRVHQLMSRAMWQES